MNLWVRIRDSIFSDPDQLSTLKSFFRIILFQLSLLVISIFFGFVLANSTSQLIKSFALSVIIANIIYHLIFFFADLGEGGDTPTDTTFTSDILDADPGEWQPFKMLKVWYAIVILLLTVVFKIYLFT